MLESVRWIANAGQWSLRFEAPSIGTQRLVRWNHGKLGVLPIALRHSRWKGSCKSGGSFAAQHAPICVSFAKPGLDRASPRIRKFAEKQLGAMPGACPLGSGLDRSERRA